MHLAIVSAQRHVYGNLVQILVQVFNAWYQNIQAAELTF
jgi:hypothetical protein